MNESLTLLFEGLLEGNYNPSENFYLDYCLFRPMFLGVQGHTYHVFPKGRSYQRSNKLTMIQDIGEKQEL